MKLIISVNKPYRWATLDDKKGKVVESGEFAGVGDGADLGQIDLKAMVPKGVKSVIGVAPAEAIALRSVEVPSKRRANVEAAVPYALEEGLSEDVDDLHFSILSWTPGAEARVAIVNKKKLEGWIADLTAAGLQVDAILPEQKMIPLHPDSEITIARTGPNRICVREGENAGLALDSDSFNYWWESHQNRDAAIAVNDRKIAQELALYGGTNINQWDIGRDFRGWLENSDNTKLGENSLLQGEYEPEHLKPTTSGLKLAAAIAGFTFFILAVANWYEVRKLENEVVRNQQEMQELFSKTFPQEEYLGAESGRRQVASLLSLSADGDNSYLFQYMLDIVSKVVPAHNATFDEVNYRNEGLQVGLTVPNFAELDKMTEVMNTKEGVAAKLISSGSRDNKTTGQIKLVRK